MHKDIRLEWVPLAYRDEVKADEKAVIKLSPVETTLYARKGVYANPVFKRKNIK